MKRINIRNIVLPGVFIFIFQVIIIFLSFYIVIGKCNSAGIGMDCSGNESLWPFAIIFILAGPPLLTYLLLNAWDNFRLSQIMKAYGIVFVIEILISVLKSILGSS